MNEQSIREALHRQGGELIDYSREIVNIGSTKGCLMNLEALAEVCQKLDNISAHAYLLRDDVEKTIQDLGRDDGV